MDLLGPQNLSPVNIFSNPFSKDKVESISIRGRKDLYDNIFEWTATIDFRSGRTSGKQEFKSENFDVLLREMKVFVDAL